MENNIFIRTIVPIFLLIGLGYFSRKKGILQSGDERALNSYVYYFALPALFVVTLSETTFNLENLKFILAGIIPIILAVGIYMLLYLIVGFSREALYLLMLTTIFGSLAFFGIPFITFAFPAAKGEALATLSAASISVVSVSIVIVVLEFYKLEKTNFWTGVKRLAQRLSHNPLILSILAGVLLSLSRAEVPMPISRFLHMLGGTTSTVAIFLLGVFLYGRTYSHVVTALKLSLLRMVFLPLVALLTTQVFHLHGLERATLVLMHSMPIAISMIILSERYDFYKETIASLLLISSLGAGVYLNVWLYLLGY